MQLGILVGDINRSSNAYYFQNQHEKYIKIWEFRRESLLINLSRDIKAGSGCLPLKVYEIIETLTPNVLRCLSYNGNITNINNTQKLIPHARLALKEVQSSSSTTTAVIATQWL